VILAEASQTVYQWEPSYPTASDRRWAVYRAPRRSCRRGARRFGPAFPGLPRDAPSPTSGPGALVESARVSSKTLREVLSGSIWALAGRETPRDACAALNTKEHLVDPGEWDTRRAELRGPHCADAANVHCPRAPRAGVAVSSAP